MESPRSVEVLWAPGGRIAALGIAYFPPKLDSLSRRVGGGVVVFFGGGKDDVD